jgi:hypothetical protein
MEKKMNPKKNLKKNLKKNIAVLATAFAFVALLPVAGAQAAKHPHHMVHTHSGPAPVAAGVALAAGTAGALASVTSPWTDPMWDGNYWAPSPWGDYDCHYKSGCLPYHAWTQH